MNYCPFLRSLGLDVPSLYLTQILPWATPAILFPVAPPANNGSVPARGHTTKRALSFYSSVVTNFAVELSIFKLFKEEAAIFLKFKKMLFLYVGNSCWTYSYASVCQLTRAFILKINSLFLKIESFTIS